MHVTSLNFSIFHETEFIRVVQPKLFGNLWKSAAENHSSLAAFSFLWEKGGEHSHWYCTASELPDKFNSATQIQRSSETCPRSYFHSISQSIWSLCLLQEDRKQLDLIVRPAVEILTPQHFGRDFKC